MPRWPLPFVLRVQLGLHVLGNGCFLLLCRKHHKYKRGLYSSGLDFPIHCFLNTGGGGTQFRFGDKKDCIVLSAEFIQVGHWLPPRGIRFRKDDER